MARRRGVWAEIQRERAHRQKVAQQQRQAAIRAGIRAQKEAEKRRRDAERQAAADEKQRRLLYIEERREKAADLSAQLGARLVELETVLADGLRRPSEVSFETLRDDVPLPNFEAHGLDVPRPTPRWEDVAPAPHRLTDKVFARSALRREEDAARLEYERRLARHVAGEAARREHLATLRAEYDRRVARIIDAHRAEVDESAQQFRAGDPQTVREYFTVVLDASPYPEGFPRQTAVGFRDDRRELVVDVELPPQTIIPSAREYRYVQSRDAIEPVPRASTEVEDRYRRLIAQIALRSIHEILRADPAAVVDVVSFNGRLSTIDRATGTAIRPHLVSVSVEREAFQELVLSEVDPVACIKHLGARVSPHPYDLDEVEPFVNLEVLLAQFSFTDGVDVLANLDSRQDLLEMSPWDFESFVKELFEAMGLKAWKTQDVHDDGVDAVVINEDEVFGGMCVVQAKRYRKVVPPGAIRDLMGAMHMKRATKGFLVTTSWVGPRGIAHADEHGRIQIIDGENLRYLCKKHLKRDILIGITKRPPPRRRRHPQ